MGFLMKSADDLAADRMTLGDIGADLYDLAALASSVRQTLQRVDCLSDAQELAIISAARLARMVADGVERAALALGHLQHDVSRAPLTALRAVPNPHPLLRLVPEGLCAGMMLTAEEAAGLETLRSLLGGKAVLQ